jgi:hypothetical protein
MTKGKSTTAPQRETRGGYPAGDKLISELKPPPPGPAPGVKAANSSDAGNADKK